MNVFTEKPIRKFIEEYCEVDDKKKIRTVKLLSAYHEWCLKHNVLALTQRQFCEAMESHGIERRRSTGNYPFFFGIDLISDGEK